MSQRECAGFNWPPLSISAEEPVSSSPVAVSRAGPGSSVNACSLSGLPRVCSARCAKNSGEPEALCQSRVAGVAQEARTAAWFSVMFCAWLSAAGQRKASVLVVVGQEDRQATAARSGPCPRMASRMPPSVDRTPLSASAAVGVGHEVQPLSDVRRTDARSAQIRSPDGVARCFQVSVNKVEPVEAVTARNLLSKDDCRAALFDEVMPRRPQVPLVSKPSSFACRAERLAGAGTGPNRSIIWPAGAAQRVGPDADAGKPVTLRVAAHVVGVHVLDAAFVNVARGDVSCGNEVAEPLRCIGVDLVVVGAISHVSTRIRQWRR